MFNQKNVVHVLVGKAVAAKAAGTVIESYADLSDGQIAVVNPDNLSLSTLASNTRFRICVRNGTSLLFTPFIDKKNIVNGRTETNVAAVQQVSYIGYDGTSGQITAIDDNNYYVRLILDSSDAQFGNRPMYKHGAYKSAATSATKSEVTLGVCASLVDNFKLETLGKIQFDAICSVAVDATYDLTNTSTVVNGSNVINVAADLTYNTAAGTLAVGDYIRFAADSLNGTLALIDPVYKVKAIDTLAVTLDRAVTCASGAWTDAGDGVQVIPAATGNAAAWGIKCTGIVKEFEVGVLKYDQVRFPTIDLINFSPLDTVNFKTSASMGKGTAEQVAERFWFAQGNWGKESRIGNPIPKSIDPGVVTGTGYNCIVLGYNNGLTNFTGTQSLPGEVLIYHPAATVVNTVIDILQTEAVNFVHGSGTAQDF